MEQHVSTSTKLAAACAGTLEHDPDAAASALIEGVTPAIQPGEADLCVLFVSGRHVTHLAELADALKYRLAPGTIIGVSAEGVVASHHEYEQRTGASVFVASMPNTSLVPFTYRELPHVNDGDDAALEVMGKIMGVEDDARGVLFFADPFSVPTGSTLDAFARLPGPNVPAMGGLASASPAPGGNALLLNDQVSHSGGIGVTIRGDIAVDALVSQGCKPIGPTMVVTKAQRNIITGLAGRDAVSVLEEMVSELDPDDRELLSNGLFVGRVIDERKPRFGRGDFLIRGILGVDQANNAIAVGDLVRTGQTVQFHARDARTAHDDLGLLLAGLSMRGPYAGGMLFTCNGRGRRLFGHTNADVTTIRRAFGDLDGALNASEQSGALPISGFFAAGEIGPIGDGVFVHGQTACLGIFRPRSGATTR
ncbi:MAG: FIST N-terminal domain-containing protein [Planctomycetota bacterium]